MLIEFAGQRVATLLCAAIIFGVFLGEAWMMVTGK